LFFCSKDSITARCSQWTSLQQWCYLSKIFTTLYINGGNFKGVPLKMFLALLLAEKKHGILLSW
jgi:hypothetical protein